MAHEIWNSHCIQSQETEPWRLVYSLLYLFYLVWNSSLWDGAAHTKGGSSPVTINHKSISSQINTQALHFKAISFHPCSHRLKAISWCEIYPIQLQNFPQSLIVLFQTLSSESLQRLRSSLNWKPQGIKSQLCVSSTLWQSKYFHSNWGETWQSKERWDQSKTKPQVRKHQGLHLHVWQLI